MVRKPSRKSPRTDWLDRPADPAVAPPAGEDGFFFFARGKKRPRWSWRDHRFGLAYGAGALVILVAMLACDAGAAATIVTAFLLALIFTVIAERRARLKWQSGVSSQVDKLASLHDRLVREVARSRGDLIQLKEGLGQTARRVSAERQPGTSSPEARMIETIVAQLSSLGTQAPPGLDTAEAPPILALEMNPPPRPPADSNAMESALVAPGGQRSEGMILRLIEQAVRNDTIDLFLQPVVSLPQRKLRMYEAFARLRAGDGLHISASHYIETAQRGKMTPAIDNLLLLRCLQMLRKAAAEQSLMPFVLNITGATLADAGFMGDLLTFLQDNRDLAANLIFEMTQEEVESLTAQASAVLAGLVKLGCVFSMDGVRKRQLDLESLRKSHIRFIKLDAVWLVREGQSRAGAARVLRFKQQLDSAGIDLIVERIENEDVLRTILDFNIDFGQGYLFGKPDVASTWLARRS